jgi:hypothetical protein
MGETFVQVVVCHLVSAYLIGQIDEGRNLFKIRLADGHVYCDMGFVPLQFFRLVRVVLDV